MTNERKLELTLCGMLPYGLECICSEDNQGVETIKGISINSKSNLLSEVITNYDCMDYQLCKPFLHSMEKLTEPILDGGIIPIVELAKIAYPNSGRKFKAENIFAVDETGLRFHYSDHGFHAFDGGNEWYVHNQLELFEKLKEWHFNIYDLPKEMYIEKSDNL